MTTIHTVPSRDFARDVGNAKRLTADGPVLITDRGKPAFALLKIEDYYSLSGKEPLSLLELMDGLPSTAGIDIDVPRIEVDIRVPHD